jgi:PRTRC genetic system ThiF family protein
VRRRAAAVRAAAPAPAQPPAVVHRVVPELLTRPVRILVVGCGGSGSEIISGLPYLHQAMLAYGHPGGLDVLLLDGDIVSPTNTVRQPFALGDIGHAKAPILINRVNAFWGLRWRAIAQHLEPNRAAPETYGRRRQGLGADVVIGCVDSRRARAIIAERVHHDTRVSYWLDLGNDASTGQFILGQPKRPGTDAVRLPTVAELYPETVDAAGDKGDDRPSCSAVEALTRQEPFVNRAIAGQALAMLARLFRYGELAYHGGYVNLASGRTMSLSVAPEQWARIISMQQTKAVRAGRSRRVKA